MYSTTEQLVTPLKSTTWQERQTAAESAGELETINDPAVEDALITTLDDHVYWVRRSAAQSLNRAGNEKANNLLLQKVKR